MNYDVRACWALLRDLWQGSVFGQFPTVLVGRKLKYLYSSWQIPPLTWDHSPAPKESALGKTQGPGNLGSCSVSDLELPGAPCHPHLPPQPQQPELYVSGVSILHGNHHPPAPLSEAVASCPCPLPRIWSCPPMATWRNCRLRGTDSERQEKWAPMRKVEMI